MKHLKPILSVGLVIILAACVTEQEDAGQANDQVVTEQKYDVNSSSTVPMTKESSAHVASMEEVLVTSAKRSELMQGAPMALRAIASFKNKEMRGFNQDYRIRQASEPTDRENYLPKSPKD